jgi:hypothetical protein
MQTRAEYLKSAQHLKRSDDHGKEINNHTARKDRDDAFGRDEVNVYRRSSFSHPESIQTT